MRSRIFSVFLISVLTLTILAGCGRADDRIEDQIDRVEDAIENTIENAVTPAPNNKVPAAPADPPVPADTTVPAGTVTQLTQTEAEAIALEHAGFTAADVSHLYSEYEIDDGTPHYDVQFYQGYMEYEYEIHAESGEIISFDRDN